MAFDISTLEQFFCSPAFTTSIGGFLGSRATELDFTKALTEEQPLKNFDIFQEYTSLVEKQLEAYLAERGLRPQAVYDACLKAQAEPHSSAWMTCIDYLVACTEYEEFMQLAYDHVSMAAYDPTSDATAWVIPAGGEEDGEEEALPVPLDEAAEEEVDIQP